MPDYGSPPFAGGRAAVVTPGLDLNLLIIFEALMEVRSVSKASSKLGISQPSLSHSLAKLRLAFDDPMFVRIKNTMEPTPRALSIVDPVRSALGLARNEIFCRQSFTPASATRTFTLCLSDSAHAVYLPSLVRKIRTVAPSIKLKAVTRNSASLESDLESGQIDLAIGCFLELKNSSYYRQRLGTTGGFVCLGNASSASIRDGRLEMAAFINASHVSVIAESGGQERAEIMLNSLKIARSVALTVQHYLALSEVISDNDFLAVVPRDIAGSLINHAGVGIYELPFLTEGVDVFQVWHRRLHHDDGNRWLRSVVKGLVQHSPPHSTTP